MCQSSCNGCCQASTHDLCLLVATGTHENDTRSGFNGYEMSYYDYIDLQNAYLYTSSVIIMYMYADVHMPFKRLKNSELLSSSNFICGHIFLLKNCVLLFGCLFRRQVTPKMAAFQQPPSATLTPPSTTHHSPLTTHHSPLSESHFMRAYILGSPRAHQSLHHSWGAPKMAPSARQLHSGQYPAAMAINILFPANHPSSVQHCRHFDSSATQKLSL